MSYRIGVRPGRGVSAAGMVVGILFILLGLFLVIPLNGAFGLLWTGVAVVITLYHAYNAFSARGISTYQVDIDGPSTGVQGLDDSLRALARLKADGLLSDEEYERKRAEIMRRQ